MGRIPYGSPDNSGTGDTSSPDIFNLFRFTSPGNRFFDDHLPTSASYFSIDGGNTKIADYGQSSDPSDFLNSGVQGPNDPFNEFYGSNTLQQLTAIDVKQLDALGFHLTTSTQQPDLVANTVSLGSTSLSIGGSTTVSYHIQDIGNASAGASVSKVYVSTDNVITTSDSLLASVNDGTLTAGNTLSDSTSVTLPSGLAAGTYWIGVIADANNQVSESNENNNVSTPIQITVAGATQQPDLVANTVSLGSTSLPVGGSTTVSYDIQNIGNAAAGASVSKVYVSTDNVITTSDTLLASINDPSTADASARAGNSVLDNTSITLPSGLAAGTYWIGVIADANNQVSESNENNNISTPIQITVTGATQQPDLVANTVSLGSTSLSIGGSTTVSYHIQDIGNASAGASVSKVYVSTDNVITTSDTLLASVNDGTITAGNSLSDSTSVTLPSGLAAGTYWIGVIADANNQVSESNENNNVSTPIQITVAGATQQPDLVANTVSLGSTSLPVGGSTTVSYDIQNIGNASAGASVSKILRLHRQCHHYVGYLACQR